MKSIQIGHSSSARLAVQIISYRCWSPGHCPVEGPLFGQLRWWSHVNPALNEGMNGGRER